MAELGFVAESERHPFCCGIDNIGNFDKVPYFWERHPQNHDPKRLQKSGTGLYTAEFIDTPKCKLAYKWLCRTKKLLYQSPIKRNLFHAHDGMFMCVFEDKK